jgi:hypothetical protein
MLDFKVWLENNLMRMTYSQKMDDRVKMGKTYESKIIDKLRLAGLKITSATPMQDMLEKVDAVWEDGPMGIGGLQIKYRDTGYDILLEAEKNGKPGRDMMGRAIYYGVVPKDGEFIYIFNAGELKNLVSSALKEAKSDFWTNKEFRSSDNITLIRTKDGYDSFISKILAYIPIDVPTPIKRIKMNLFK